MTRATIGREGLCRHLGETIFWVPKDKEDSEKIEGILTYPMKNFAIYVDKEYLENAFYDLIREGDTVHLRAGKGKRKFNNPKQKETYVPYIVV